VSRGPTPWRMLRALASGLSLDDSIVRFVATGGMLAAVVCQHLGFRDDLGIRLPECEILRSTSAVKNFIRRGDFHQMASAMETGAESGGPSLAIGNGWKIVAIGVFRRKSHARQTQSHLTRPPTQSDHGTRSLTAYSTPTGQFDVKIVHVVLAADSTSAASSRIGLGCFGRTWDSVKQILTGVKS